MPRFADTLLSRMLYIYCQYVMLGYRHILAGGAFHVESQSPNRGAAFRIAGLTPSNDNGDPVSR